MRAFRWVSATDVDGAVAVAAIDPGACYLAGGTNLVDLMRRDVHRPSTVIDISRLPLGRVDRAPDGGLRIGALVRMGNLLAHPVVRARYPALARAVLATASGQLRTMATVGGNLLQRSRCPYYLDVAARCNRREPGAGCDAIGADHPGAILAAGEHCVDTHASDLAVALLALDAVVVVQGVAGTRRVPLGALHRLPGAAPHRATVLDHGDLVTAVEVPAAGTALNCFRSVRHRASFATAQVSVAAALTVRDGVVSRVRLALGGVAPTPWRARTAERLLLGAPATDPSFRAAATAELAPAPAGYRAGLAGRMVVAALHELTAGPDAR